MHRIGCAAARYPGAGPAVPSGIVAAIARARAAADTGQAAVVDHFPMYSVSSSCDEENQPHRHVLPLAKPSSQRPYAANTRVRMDPPLGGTVQFAQFARADRSAAEHGQSFHESNCYLQKGREGKGNGNTPRGARQQARYFSSSVAVHDESTPKSNERYAYRTAIDLRKVLSSLHGSAAHPVGSPEVAGQGR